MRVSVGDVRLFFDVDGAKLVPDGPVMREKPTLLLLHGGPGFDHSRYKPDWPERLADICQLVYLDHRGNGRSDHGDPERWTLEQWGDDIFAFCEALEIERPIVMGDSFGGYVAQSYATRHPNHPGKLILMSTTARWDGDHEHRLAAFERRGGPAAREAARRWLTEERTPEIIAEYRRLCLPLYTATPSPETDERRRLVMRRVVTNDAVSQAFGRLTWDLRPQLGRITCPTLVLGGAESPLVPPAEMEEMVAALTNVPVRYESILGAGHSLGDRRDELFGIIREFILDESA